MYYQNLTAKALWKVSRAPMVWDLNGNPPTVDLIAGDIINCSYSGTIKSVKLPVGSYQLETWGGGGSGTENSAGGYSIGNMLLMSSTILFCVAGGGNKLDAVSPGYNGGGTGYVSTTTGSHYRGAGATHVGTKSGLLTSFESDYWTYLVMVAGGSGSTGSSTNAGEGGGLKGGDGQRMTTASYATGGTQTSGGVSSVGDAHNGKFGEGGSASITSMEGGGGGGGLYGGAAGGKNGFLPLSGGGGSGFINPAFLTDAHTDVGYTVANPDTSYNGYIRITVLSVN